jgi:hypothetical protein
MVGALLVLRAHRAIATVATSTTMMTMTGGQNVRLIEITHEICTTGLKRDAFTGTKTMSSANDHE